MAFWIIAGSLALLTALSLGLALMRRRDVADHPATYDLQVYRDQLSEIDRDLARDVIAPEDVERTRTEISRRILTADAQLRKVGEHTDAQGAVTLLPAFLLGMVLIGAGFVGYSILGAPGYGDLPLQQRKEDAKTRHAARMSQAAFEYTLPPRPAPQPDAEFGALMVKLRETVINRPNDLTGQSLLARNEASLGNFHAAYDAQQQVIRLKGEAATTEDYLRLADYMIIAAEGYVSPEAEDALKAVLRADPENGLGQYYVGLMLIQAERPDLAYRMWNTLLHNSSPAAPWYSALLQRLPDLASLAGTEFTPPQNSAGPDQDDIDAAAELTPEERQQMIQGMVAQLSERLATEGGPPQEWARLIAAYGVLENQERAAMIWENAQEVFATNPEGLAMIQSAAQQAGVVN